MKKPPNFPRLRALYAFTKLSRTLTSDVLAKSDLAERFDIAVNRPIELSPGTVIGQPELFSAFRQAMGGEVIAPLVDLDGKPVTAEVSIDGQGTVSSKLATGR